MIENIGKIRQNRDTNSSGVKEQKRMNALWFSTMQILQHGHSCSLQYRLNFSWCSSQSSLISNTYDGNFRYSAEGIVVWFREDFA
jgi:hypothetical protein